jgi:hypothetical protein
MHCKAGFLALVLVAAFSGCVQEPGPEPGPGVSPLAAVIFEPLVKGCAETEQGMASRGFGFVESGPSLSVEGSTLVYSRSASHLCCRKAVISRELIEGSGMDSVLIYETWSGPGCRCICDSELAAKLENLPDGTYNVKVVSRGFDPESGGEFEEVLLEELVSVPGPEKKGLSLEEMQGCQSDGDCVLVQEGCCPCALGGRMVSVNGGFSEQYDSAVLEECKRSSGACVSLEDDPSCSEAAYAGCVGEKCSVLVADEPLVPCPDCGEEAVD